MSELSEAAIVRLVQLAEERDLAFLHVRAGSSELRVARVPPEELAGVEAGLAAPEVASGPVGGSEEPPAPAPSSAAAPSLAAAPSSAPAPSSAAERAVEAPRAPAAANGGATIDAPMVGAFYRAPAPGQEPFVEVGSVVEVGTTVGLVEAMKVFTAVPASCAGVVAEILVDDGAFVEFGQPLMALEPERAGEREEEG